MDLEQKLISRDYNKLPKEYWINQNLCWYLHDIILSLFKEVIDDNLIDSEINLKSKKEEEEFAECEDIYGWLRENNREEEFVKVLCRDLSMRLLADFLNYIYETLSNLERGKITVACDLLRKPFKDNLLYMEWILFNDKQISNLVYNGDIDKYAIGRSGLSKEFIKEIVNYNVKRNRFVRRFESLEIEKSIYDIRYNYNSPNSLELIWNKATHLVTTGKHIRTNEFNFLYNNELDYSNCYSYLYSKIPILLLYTIGIVEEIFNKYFREIKKEIKDYNWYLIMSKFSTGVSEDFEQETKKAISSMNDFIKLPCENCKKIITLRKPETYMFDYYWYVLCPKCKEEIDLCKYFFL